MVQISASKIFTAVFGSRNQRILNNYQKTVYQISAAEPEFRKLTDEQLRGKTDEFRGRLKQGESIEDVLVEACAAIREASRRGRNHRQFNVQLSAGLALHDNKIAEEATGEGKTIACYPAIYLECLLGKKVHVVTVNDYLVKRDRDFAAPIFELLGLTVGAIQANMDASEADERKAQYNCDITYGTNSEFGFDYLRDNMKMSAEAQAQGPLDFAIIDEVDSILIDEARTPLIISGPAYDDVRVYKAANDVAKHLLSLQDQAIRECQQKVKNITDASGPAAAALLKFKHNPRLLNEEEAELIGLKQYLVVERDRHSAKMTEDGQRVAEEQIGLGPFSQASQGHWIHRVNTALRAHEVYKKEQHYIVQNDQVVIVDEFTGRLMEGRQWSEGLHQAVESKEGVTVKQENQTLATITLQNLFRLYGKLAGMTGTAMTESEEFHNIYKLETVALPTHRPVNRVDHEDVIYRTIEEKWQAIIDEIVSVHESGRPVLVGTTSVEHNEKLSQLLTRNAGVVHEVLNAKNHAREAEIVSMAGHRHKSKKEPSKEYGNVTVATNMAGRGTDIKLAPAVVYEKCIGDLGPPEQNNGKKWFWQEKGVVSTKCCIKCPDYDKRTNCGHCWKPKVDPAFPARGRDECLKQVPCGLHIVGTERHEARRIDNQLRGRSGRQGDPGSTRFFLSLRDDLIRIFAPEWTIKMLEWLGLEEGMAIENKRISNGIARAQSKVEERNFAIRKNLLEYDGIMDAQRKYFYSLRQKILEGRDIPQTVWDMIERAVDEAVQTYLQDNYSAQCVARWARENLNVAVSASSVSGKEPEELENYLKRAAADEIRSTVALELGEHIDEEEEASKWDLRGVSRWAMSRFNVSISQGQLRKMTLEDIQEAVSEAAIKKVEEVDCSELNEMLAEGFNRRALAEWAKEKFDLTVHADSFADSSAEQVRTALLEQIKEVYHQREIQYPVDWAIEMSLAGSNTEDIYAIERLVNWANHKYNKSFKAQEFQGQNLKDIRQRLLQLSQEFLDDDQARGEGVERDFIRQELTELERFILLHEYDSGWKEHLLGMDHLRDSIGLRGYAERDPKIEYTREGSRLFEEMLQAVQSRVTDLLFKVKLTSADSVRSVYNIAQTRHDLMQTDYSQEAGPQAQAAEPPPVAKTIRKETPKVGRNDPCPCGSGKKYKKCCGRN
ncbi:MAG: preprotein translocase subunit SecA [Actinobacteria bacterium]|nr:preprotein translocase subunit SecA [Actinomycetota bacterium]